MEGVSILGILGHKSIFRFKIELRKIEIVSIEA